MLSLLIYIYNYIYVLCPFCGRRRRASHYWCPSLDVYAYDLRHEAFLDLAFWVTHQLDHGEHAPIYTAISELIHTIRAVAKELGISCLPPFQPVRYDDPRAQLQQAEGHSNHPMSTTASASATASGAEGSSTHIEQQQPDTEHRRHHQQHQQQLHLQLQAQAELEHVQQTPPAAAAGPVRPGETPLSLPGVPSLASITANNTRNALPTTSSYVSSLDQFNLYNKRRG